MIFRFMRAKANVDTRVETEKLRIAMVDSLLEQGFTWKEIEQGLGFSEAWYRFTERLIKSVSK